MRMKQIGVLGSGIMGAGIIQVFAQNGYEVVFRARRQESIDKGIMTVVKNLERLVAKEKITEAEKVAALARINGSTDLNIIKDADLVIEAATESLEGKIALFKEIDKICGPHTIFATNTSSLPITELAAATSRPDKFVGMHFFNPVPVMKLVEIIRGLATTDGVTKVIYDLTAKLNKIAVEVNDSPGFISNRVLMPMINEAIFTVYEGIAEPKAVDDVMKFGMNHPMGPLALADMIGLDTCLSIMEVLYAGFADSKYRPCPLLKKYVNAGWLGKKSGRGFYIYQ